MNSHEELRSALIGIRYPAGIVACPHGYCAIQGQSFFPGGRGHLGTELPVGGVMFLGHNFDKVSGYEQSVSRGYEENLTWRVIRAAVFKHIPAERIWFTNYFMGVLERDTNEGPLDRGSGFSEYEKDCWDFLGLQVTLQKPEVIVALGKEVVRTLGIPSRFNIPRWVVHYKYHFGQLRGRIEEVTFNHHGHTTSTKVIAAYHPSYGRGELKSKTIEEDAAFIASKVQLSPAQLISQ